MKSQQTFQVGLGYRRALHDEMMALDPRRLDFVEIAPENYVGLGGAWRRRLDAVRAKWPILTHSFALSVGGLDPFDPAYVDAIGAFVADVGSPHHSDHVCWSSANGSHLHELLPTPYTMANAAHVASRIRDAQSAMPVPFAIENVSSYLRQPEDTMSEAEFVSELVARTGCGLLLDVNNIYVNSQNFGFDPFAMLAKMPVEATVQIHVAGFEREGDLLIDTHGAEVADPVWPLLEEALRRTGPVPVLLERDNRIPDLDALLAEIDHIRAIGARVFGAEPLAARSTIDAPREAAHG